MIVDNFIKKALTVSASVGCGFEGDSKDAKSILNLITDLESRISELEAAQRWRVVANGELPNKNDYYLARDDLGQQGMILFYDGEWNKFTNLSYITLWMPLPELPKEREE